MTVIPLWASSVCVKLVGVNLFIDLIKSASAKNVFNSVFINDFPTPGAAQFIIIGLLVVHRIEVLAITYKNVDTACFIRLRPKCLIKKSVMSSVKISRGGRAANLLRVKASAGPPWAKSRRAIAL
ncbi:hypothetical protein [Bufonid herpesvirus 1]|uniref:hypothetical protein n=1 Tax=Bufonid herpesvirus 1 TaxID=2282206 RepID=UPI000EB7064B|nr:hypothetical protein [Bufonid herpesvirus 1]AXF48561.1 hypothetical protein [Bufonid herpesvirus 1]